MSGSPALNVSPVTGVGQDRIELHAVDHVFLLSRHQEGHLRAGQEVEPHDLAGCVVLEKNGNHEVPLLDLAGHILYIDDI